MITLPGVDPEILSYLIAVLALISVWQYHRIQVKKGRILAIDVFDRSGIRFYLYMAANEPTTCEVCREASGRAFLPGDVAKKHFKPLARPCLKNPTCDGALIGLYGAWSEARQVLERLNLSRKKAAVRLSMEELATLINGPWERSVSAETDRLSVHMLEAFQSEEKKPETAIRNYRYVIDQAKEMRHLPYLMPSYLRLTEVLTRAGRVPEAIRLIDEFEGRYRQNRSGEHAPTEVHFGTMSIKKSRLKNRLSQAGAALAS